MADEGPTAEDVAGIPFEGEQRPKRLVRRILFILVLVLLLAIIIGGAVLFFLSGSDEDMADEDIMDDAAEESFSAVQPLPEQPLPPGFFVSLPEVTVNIQSDGRRRIFGIFAIDLEVGSEADAMALESEAPRILDNFQAYLREQSEADFFGSAGTYAVRQDLLRRARLSAHPIEVTNVLFRTLIVN